jgi:molybdate transport system substrate-binding protein
VSTTRAVLAVAVALSLVACDDATDDGGARLVVFAASSLTEVFTQLATSFEDERPGVEVELSFGSSTALAEQLRQGARADVYAAADEESFGLVADLAGAPVTFARNRLAILVETGNPKRIRLVRDLSRTDVTFVVCDADVPCGRLAARALDAVGVTRDPASLEGSVKAVVSKVVLGEADAGIVFASDVVAAGGRADGVAIPDGPHLTTSYPIAVLDDAANAEAAAAWIALVRSAEGRRALEAHGFLR